MSRRGRRAGRQGGGAVGALLAEGVELHRQGRLREAEALYRRALAKAPKNADALHLMGVVAHQGGRHKRAVELIGRALKLHEPSPLYHHNLGLALCALGRPGDAAPHFRRAVALDAGYVEGWISLGAALETEGDAAEARKAAERALALAPDHAGARSLLGRLHAASGELGAAAAELHRAVAADPDDAATHNNLGNVLAGQGNADEAIAAFRKAIALDAGHVEARLNLGDILREANRADEAEAALRGALAIDASHARAWSSLGLALEDQGRLKEAEDALRRALALDDGLAATHNNLGNLLRALGRDADSIACFDAAIARRPGYDDAVVNRGLALLALGRCEEGWRDCRLRASARRLGGSIRQDRLPDSLAGLRILVHRDQGLGDEIFFLRFVRALKTRGAWIAYRSQAKIAPMAARLDFIDEVIDEETGAPVPPGIDVALSAGDLPLMLGLDSADRIPPSITIPLRDGLAAEMQARLEAMGPPPRLGLTWRAGIQKRDRLSKIVPLEGFARTLRGLPHTLIALQRGPAPGEIDRIAEVAGRTVHDATALNDDLERMLALLDALDFYVCVSNTNLHLRAARGRTSRVLVPLPADYRWMAEGTDSPWFPSCPVYREDAAEGWRPALAALAGDLARG